MRQDVDARRHRGTAAEAIAHRPRGLALIGLLTVLDGAWGAAVPFIGPLFGYRSHGQGAWQWSSLHGVLYLAPGAVAVLFGLIILARARSVTRGPVGFAGLVVAACGAWFVVGPALWPTFGTGPVFTPASTAMDNFVHQVGYNLGVGVILAMLGGMALKALARDRVVPVEGREAYADRAPVEPARREPYAPVEPAHREAEVDRGRVDPTRRESMTPGSGRGVDRVSDERLAARDRGPGDRTAEVGDGTSRRPADETRGERLPRDERTGREGVVAADELPGGAPEESRLRRKAVTRFPASVSGVTRSRPSVVASGVSSPVAVERARFPIAGEGRQGGATGSSAGAGAMVVRRRRE